MRNYHDPQYKKWIKDIKSRDKYTCQWPGCKSNKKLHAHHIQKWSDFPGLRFHLDNGITLCKYHHSLIHNNEESYSSFFFRLILKNKGQ